VSHLSADRLSRRCPKVDISRALDEHHDDAGRSESVVTRFNVSPVMVVSAICALYVLLGTAMEELSMWADVIRLAILIAFPILSLWLPSMTK